MVSIRLMNDAPENHGYGESGAGSRIGVLAMGDIDGSGAVDEDDKEELLKLAASGQVHDDLFYEPGRSERRQPGGSGGHSMFCKVL